MAEFRLFRLRCFQLLARILWHSLDLPLWIYYYCFPALPARRGQSCVLIHSFDGYKRFWPPALYFAQKSLPQSLPLLCASEYTSMPVSSEASILTRSGCFVWRLIVALHRLRRTFCYVLYLQEDMWLSTTIPADHFAIWIQLMDLERMHCLKLSRESFLADDMTLIAQQPPIAADSFENFTWFGSHDFLMSHHGSLFHVDYLFKTLCFALLLGARKPKEHEILISRALQHLTFTPDRPRRSLRIACWRLQPVLTYIHASDGGELTHEARHLLSSYPDCPGVDESLPGEVFPARQV